MRAALRSVAAMLYASVLTLVFTSNEDFSINTASRAFLPQQAAAILMACCAGVAAFASVVPGYSRWVFVLPALGVATWLADHRCSRRVHLLRSGEGRGGARGWRIDTSCCACR